MRIEKLILAGNTQLQDRLEIYSEEEDRTVVALADGAGGSSGGAEAAQTLIRIVAENKALLRSAGDCVALLQTADEQISDDAVAGETTGLVLITQRFRIFGASAGDSEAWFYSLDAMMHLTRDQRRKPFLGSGGASAAAFSFEAREGLILIASDGLWKYTSQEKIAAEVQRADRSTLLDRLSNLVRLRSGALQDDVAMAILDLR
jgi:serine/threonine protein phosphatase PrpC